MTNTLIADSTPFKLDGAFFTNNPGAKEVGTTPGSLISALLPNLIMVAGIIMLVLILYSGFHLVSDAGSTNAQNIAKHKSMITVGIIGFLIVMASYFILQFILGTLGISTIMQFNI